MSCQALEINKNLVLISIISCNNVATANTFLVSRENSAIHYLNDFCERFFRLVVNDKSCGSAQVSQVMLIVSALRRRNNQKRMQ